MALTSAFFGTLPEAATISQHQRSNTRFGCVVCCNSIPTPFFCMLLRTGMAHQGTKDCISVLASFPLQQRLTATDVNASRGHMSSAIFGLHATVRWSVSLKSGSYAPAILRVDGAVNGAMGATIKCHIWRSRALPSRFMQLNDLWLVVRQRISKSHSKLLRINRDFFSRNRSDVCRPRDQSRFVHRRTIGTRRLAQRHMQENTKSGWKALNCFCQF